MDFFKIWEVITNSPIFDVSLIAVVTGFVLNWFRQRSSNKKSGDLNLNKALTLFDQDNQRLRNELDKVRKEITDKDKKYDLMKELISVMEQELTEMKAHNQILKEKVNLLESSQMKLPIPMWLKDREGKMLSLNPYYEEVFLKPFNLTAQDYIGKTDYDVWPKEIADAYAANDRKAFAQNQTQYTIETVPNVEGVKEDWIIIKYIRYIDDIAVGVAGMAIPIEKFKNNDNVSN